MQSVVHNSSSTQNRDLLCFFPFSSVDTHWGSQGKKKKIGEFSWKIGMAAGADILFLEMSPPKQLGNLGSK